MDHQKTQRKRLISMVLLLFLFLFFETLLIGYQKGQTKSAEIDKTFSKLSLEELLNIKVRIASKSSESIFDAPSIVTVITKDEIEAINPRNMTDILQTIPSFNYHTRNLGETLFQIRGIHSVNDTILLMLDGHPLNDRIFGTMIYILNSIPTEIIERIEIIRGPGSTIYGSNAFYGVINIITIKDKNIDRKRIIGKFGSEKTTQGVVIIKNKNREKKTHFIASGSIGQTEGPKLDFTDRSGISGKTFFEQERTNLYLNYKKDSFSFLGLFNTEELGPYVGIAYRLNNRTKRKYTTIALESKIEFSLNKRIDMSGKVYYDSFIYDCYWEFLPKNLYPPNGMLTDAYAQDMRLGSEWNLKINLSEKHRLLTGFVFNYLGLKDGWSAENSENPFQLTDSESFWISNGKETNFAFYIQDNYFITPNLQLVLGIRYDNHTVYGDSWNPRGGLTFRIGEHSNLKLLYGQAFRAPNFWDLNANSPDLIQNPNLKPEQIRTIDLELSSSISNHLLGRVNLYSNRITDLIQTTPIIVDNKDTGIKKNIGKISVTGIEAELRGNFLYEKHKFTLNGFYCKSRDVMLKQDVVWIPNFGLGLLLHNKWSKNINTSIQVKHIGKIKREEGNPLPDLKPYTLVNISVKYSISNLLLKGSIYNFFDTQYFSPSPYSKRIDDYPHLGRTFLFSIEYNLGD